MVQPSAPGWYDDPSDSGRQRYFDGVEWTSLQAPGPTFQPVPFSPGAPELSTVSKGPRSALAHVGEIWRGYSRLVQLALVLSVVAGVAVVIAGVSGDSLHWWDGLSFTPNVLDSVAGFLIGAPMALVLVEAVTASRIETSDRTRLDEQSRIAWANFTDRVWAFCSDARLSALAYLAENVGEWWANARSALHPYIVAVNGHRELSEADYASATTLFSSLADELGRLMVAIDPLVVSTAGSGATTPEWVGVSKSWDFLDSYVRIQRLASDCGWLADSVDTSIRLLISKGDPLERFSRLHGVTSSPFESPGMAGVYQYLRLCAHAPRKVLSRILEDRSTGPYTLLAKDYVAEALNAYAGLSTLRELVLVAESGGGWPLPPADKPRNPPARWGQGRRMPKEPTYEL